MWAASNIVVRCAQRSTPQFDVVPFMVWSSLVPILPFILLSLAFDPPSTPLATGTALAGTTWASMAYLGWFATILGYAMWTGLLKRHPVNRVAPFSLAVPVVGIAPACWCWASRHALAMGRHRAGRRFAGAGHRQAAGHQHRGTIMRF